MKKLLAGVAVVLLVGCSTDISQYTTTSSDSSAKAKMQACMISEANTKLQAGTLFSAGVSDTANELVNTCLKKLALESAGISSESQSAAESIITNLKNLTASSN
jgi:hypothetical protein